MTRRISVVLAAGGALLVGTAMLAAPGQDRPAPGTERPGQITRGQVFIENRGRNEAIPIVAPEPVPVVVQNVATNSPMSVRLSGSSPGSPPPPVAVRNVAQEWDYQTLSVPQDISPQDLTRMLAAPGNMGWEPAGVQIASRGSTLLVLKRARS